MRIKTRNSRSLYPTKDTHPRQPQPSQTNGNTPLNVSLASVDRLRPDDATTDPPTQAEAK